MTEPNIDAWKFHPFDTIPDPLTAEAVVGVRLVFRIHGELVIRDGSGFFAGSWAQAIVTARHNILVPSDVDPDSMKLFVKMQTEHGEKIFRAWGAAYPTADKRSMDCGIIMLQDAVATLNGLRPVAQAPQESAFKATISGYPSASEHDITNAAVDGTLLHYGTLGVPGWSGGPVVGAGGVVGIHIANGLGVVLPMATLNACVRALN